MNSAPTFQYVTEPPREVICSICLKPWYNPVETPCEHIYCEPCVKDALSRLEQCPECRHPVAAESLRRVTRLLRQQVDRLEVRCAGSAKGCPWTGPREEVSAHETQCSNLSPTPVPSNPSNPDGPMKVSVANEYDSYVHSTTAKVLTVLHLDAPALPPSVLEAARKPIHVSAVLDVSGSMSGSKISLLKDTMRFVVREMQPADTLGITLYNNDAWTALEETVMNGDGKARALQAIDAIKAGGGTNIEKGLFTGMRQFGFDYDGSRGSSATNRRGTAQLLQSPQVSGNAVRRASCTTKGFFSSLFQSSGARPESDNDPKTKDDDTRSVWLLTDGDTNSGITGAPEFAQAMKLVMGQRKDVTVYSFGFGTPHNEELLSTISETGGGQYYFVRDLESIKKSFADCLGGLMSVVAKNIEIHGSAHSGVKILRMLGEDDAVKGGLQCHASIRDLQSEEQRDIVVEVEIPALPAPDADTARPMITWTVSYVSVLDGASWQVMRSAAVSRPAHVDTQRKADERVTEQRTRVQVKDAMSAATERCNAGDYGSAQVLLQQAENEATKLQSRGGELLARKCRAAQETSASATSWFKGGRHQMKNMVMEQQHQRSCAPELDEDCMYTNVFKSEMKRKC